MILSIGIHIDVIFKIQAAFQLATLPSQLLRVRQDLLYLGGTRCDRLEISQPRTATKFSATSSYSTHLASLLTNTNLFHFHSDLEFFGKNLNQVAEINSFFCSIIKDRL